MGSESFRKTLRAAQRGKTLVGDAGLGARLFERAQQSSDPPALLDLWNVERPQLVRELHERDVAAGAQLLVTNSFRSDALSLAEIGREAESRTLARASAELARRAAENANAHVLGSLGPGPGTGDEKARWEEHFEAARGLLDGGVDGLLIETIRHPARGTAVIDAADRARRASSQARTPLLVSFTPDLDGNLADGTALEDVVARNEGMIDALGLNCVPLDVDGLSKILERLSSLGLPLFLAPNPAPGEAGIDAFAEGLHRLASKHDLAFVRGCCGSTTEHIAALRLRF